MDIEIRDGKIEFVRYVKRVTKYRPRDLVARDPQKACKDTSDMAALIRKFRYVLLGTHSGYKLITNGYGQLKKVVLTDGTVISRFTISNKLHELCK